ncbi:MAG: peptide-methionine (S)-S-oxide reductase MsrA [Akkermansiaceae bacterium]
MKRFLTTTIPLACLGAVLVWAVFSQSSQSQDSMENNQPAKIAAIPEGYQTATLGAGCYWCVEAVLEQLDGVHSCTSGFMGGHVDNPKYDAVCQGTTGHAEVVQVVFNPKKISYEKLLEWFWKLHDPTQIDGQGNDLGTQYRSAIFFHSDAQKTAAVKSRTKAQEKFPKPIATEIAKASKFFPAKVSHQDYYRLNKNKNPYCRAVITPKLDKLKLKK